MDDKIIFDLTNPSFPEAKTEAIIKKCPFCHKDSEILLNADDLAKWRKGYLVQQAFPYLKTDDREMIVTGSHTECWDTQLAQYE